MWIRCVVSHPRWWRWVLSYVDSLCSQSSKVMTAVVDQKNYLEELNRHLTWVLSLLLMACCIMSLVKVNIAPRSEHTSEMLRYSTRSQGISQFYLHTLCSSANRMNHTCLFFLAEASPHLLTTERWEAELAGYLVQPKSKTTHRCFSVSTALFSQYRLVYLKSSLMV